MQIPDLCLFYVSSFFYDLLMDGNKIFHGNVSKRRPNAGLMLAQRRRRWARHASAQSRQQQLLNFDVSSYCFLSFQGRLYIYY